MRILVISNLYPPDVLGGYELGCRQAVDALRGRGHDVLVLTAVPRAVPCPPAPGVVRRLRLTDIFDPITEANTPAPVKKLRYLEAFGVNPGNVHALTEVVAEFRPDVVYCWNLIGVGGLGLLAATQQLGVPWVMHLMDKVPRELCGLWPEAVPTPAMVRTFLRLCRGRFLCCSRTTLAEIAVGGLDLADRTTLLPNWVTTAGSPDRAADSYRPGGTLRVVQAGALVPWKGVDITIRAAGLLRDRGHSNFTVDLFGFGDEVPYRTLVQSLGLAEFIRLRGPRTQAELYAAYPSCDVFSFPTWDREPMAFAPLEAAAHGCATVLPVRSGNSEWFEHGVDCLKAERCPEGFADALEALLTGRASVADLGRRGMARVLGSFRLDSAVEVIEAALAAAVRAGGGPPTDPGAVFRTALLAEKTFAGLIHDIGRADAAPTLAASSPIPPSDAELPAAGRLRLVQRRISRVVRFLWTGV
ncbi:MAG: glycosyltransferase family 4 protein [Fimbriiglobus sp.]